MAAPCRRNPAVNGGHGGRDGPVMASGISTPCCNQGAEANKDPVTRIQTLHGRGSRSAAPALGKSGPWASVTASGPVAQWGGPTHPTLVGFPRKNLGSWDPAGVSGTAWTWRDRVDGLQQRPAAEAHDCVHLWSITPCQQEPTWRDGHIAPSNDGPRGAQPVLADTRAWSPRLRCKGQL